MFLVAHIVIALLSLINTAVLYFSPSNIKYRASYLLIALTIASGTYLVMSMRVNMLRVCGSGLVYLAVTILGLNLAHRKQAISEKIKSE